MSAKLENRGHVKRYASKDIIKYLTELHGSRFVEYRKEWDMSETGKYVPKAPLQFLLELTSYCNLNCKMCYHSVKTDKTAHNISMDIVDNAIAQCKELKIPSITIGSAGECMIHPQVKDIISKIKQTEVMDFFIYTNGHRLTEEIMNLLIELKIERLNISLDAATEATYKKIRGRDLNSVEKNIYRFLELKEEKKSDLPFLRLSFVKTDDNLDEMELFYEKWKNDADLVDFQDYINLLDVDNLADLPDIDSFVCPHPFQQLTVDCKGDILPCCTFYNKYLKIGNIKDMTIIEAWHSEKMQKIRDSFFNGKIHKACKNCYGNMKHRENVLKNA